MQRLEKLLHNLDGKGYKAYKDIKGSYQFGDFDVTIDHVQGDPFAAPSRVSVRVPITRAAIPESLWASPDKEDNPRIMQHAKLH